MRTLVIGDLHFDVKPLGLLEAQKNFVIKLYNKEREFGKIDNVIFLGDLMMHRRPYPSILLALQEMLDYVSHKSNVYIVRGNHDSENKSDDGITALSLFVNNKIKVFTQEHPVHEHQWYFIPHFEDEGKIKEALAKVPMGYTVFGHFGFNGALNSAGDNDFALSIDDFRNPSVLGHVHTYHQKKNVLIVGTPYTTSFQEADKPNLYMMIENDVPELKEINFGPRHLVIPYDKVEENLTLINDPDYFTMLRIVLSSLNEDQHSVVSLIDQTKVAYVETRYKPLMRDKEKSVTLDLTSPLNSINDDIIDEYINESGAIIAKERLLEGLKLIHENKQNKHQ